MLIQILFTLQSVPANSHAVVGGVHNVSVVQFTHCLELGKHAADLLVDIFATSKLSPNFVTNSAFITSLPYTGNLDCIAKAWMSMMERMFRQPVDWQVGLLGISGRKGILFAVIHRPIFFQKLRRAITHIMRMGKSEVDEKGILVLGLLSFA